LGVARKREAGVLRWSTHSPARAPVIARPSFTLPMHS